MTNQKAIHTNQRLADSREECCRMCGSKAVQLMRRFESYPIFIGCTDAPPSEDELYDFEVYQCLDCGVIQQLETPPLDILYRENRAFGIGGIWREHYEQYFDFINMDKAASVLEVGGGNGLMLQSIADQHPDVELFDIEPNPQYDIKSVTTIREYFDKSFRIDRSFDVIFSSHLIEHLLDVNEFFAAAKRHLKPGGSLYTACPNIVKSFGNLHLNAFTTDHFNYFTPHSLAELAKKNGLTAVDIKFYRDHGMYLRYQHSEEVANPIEVEPVDIQSLFLAYEKKICQFANYVADQNLDTIILFGAHAFTITFLYYLREACGAQMPKITALLDNEPTKADRRLTGTSYISRLPADYLPSQIKPVILIYMGAYTQEISKQLEELNPTARLIRLDEFASGQTNKPS